MDKFVFTFQMPFVYQSLPPTPTPAPTASSTLPLPLIPLIPNFTDAPNATSSHAAAQARYRARNADSEREKAKQRMRKLRGRDKEPKPERYNSSQLRAISSKELRASRTFAAFREYVQDYMFWVVVNEDDPEEVAAYNRFMYTNLPSEDRELPEEDLEFLFRHIHPEPQGIDVSESN
ncbi:hypothetical protein C8R46DRAFT_1239364 [Mycena filopes]|nr:hypothetical protein C8R46DRAFT_1239364 [Mycena filopes]